MSRFEILGQDFGTWRRRHFDDIFASYDFACQFTNLWRTYVEAPASFDEDGKKCNYVELRRVNIMQDDVYKSAPANGPTETLTRVEDGTWLFAIVTTLETGPNTWPKQSFAVPIWISLQNTPHIVRVTKRSDGEFRVDPSDPVSFHPAFEFMITLLGEILSASPYDRGETKKRIGFDLPIPAPDATR